MSQQCETCLECVFFRVTEYDDKECKGHCRKRAPYNDWPIVLATDWCGDFVREDVADPPRGEPKEEDVS